MADTTASMHEDGVTPDGMEPDVRFPRLGIDIEPYLHDVDASECLRLTLIRQSAAAKDDLPENRSPSWLRTTM